MFDALSNTGRQLNQAAAANNNNNNNGPLLFGSLFLSCPFWPSKGPT